MKDTQNQYESQRAQFAQQAQQPSGVDARLQNIVGKIETLTETTVALANRFERVELSIGKLGKSLQARGVLPTSRKRVSSWVRVSQEVLPKRNLSPRLAVRIWRGA